MKSIKVRASRKITLINEVWNKHLWVEQYDTRHVFILVAEIVDNNREETFPAVQRKFKEQLYRLPVNGCIISLR